MSEETNLITKEKGDLVYSGFVFKENAVIPVGNPQFEQWTEAWNFANKAEGACQWWIGDLLNLGLTDYPEKVTAILDGYDYETKNGFKYVCERIPALRRRKASFSVHREIAPFEPEEQDILLDKAVKNSLTIQQLRKEKHKILLDSKRQTASVVDPALILGDAIEQLELLPDKSIDCLITDAPYGIDYQSNRRVVNPQLDKIAGDTNEAFALLDKVCEILSRKIKDNSHLYFFTSWKVECEFRRIISKYFEVTNVLVWDKLNHGSGDLEGNYGERYEQIIFASKGRRILNGDSEDNILAYSRVANFSHPTEKPVGLIKKLIEKSTNEGELVVDPFCRSGSTCLAAKQANRKYIGIEIDPQWFALAQVRMEKGE